MPGRGRWGPGPVLVFHFGDALCGGEMLGRQLSRELRNLSLESGERRESRCVEGRGPGAWWYKPEQGMCQGMRGVGKSVMAQGPHLTAEAMKAREVLEQ